jgi:hypothetical protein
MESMESWTRVASGVDILGGQWGLGRDSFLECLGFRLRGLGERPKMKEFNDEPIISYSFLALVIL